MPRNNDQAVEDGIKAAVANLTPATTYVKPNKLRKVVCKSVPGATWTRFQTCLEGMIERGDMKTTSIMEGSEKVVVLVVESKGAKQRDTTTATTTTTTQSSKKNNKKDELTVDIPLAVAHFLTRKGRRKKKHVEQLTKTQFIISGLKSNANKKPNDDVVTLTIIKKYTIIIDDENKNCEGDAAAAAAEAKETAAKQIKDAKRIIDKITESYREHPDRYKIKKCGGTFAEQEEAKKLRAEGTKRSAGKHHERSAADSNDAGAGGDASKKKKKRKFF
jgi:hypothetical protein